MSPHGAPPAHAGTPPGDVERPRTGLTVTLRHETDVSVADWIVRDAAPGGDVWTRLTDGPPGFEAYVTVAFDGVDASPYRSDPELVADVTRLAAEHTTTPERCWFALWDGWGEIDGGRTYAAMGPDRLLGRMFSAPRPVEGVPAFGPDVLSGPRVDLGGVRSYLLFVGAASDAGTWPARPPRPGWPADVPQASFTWPADRAWCIASDVDADAFTVGGSARLAEALLTNPGVEARPTDP